MFYYSNLPSVCQTGEMDFDNSGKQFQEVSGVFIFLLVKLPFLDNNR